MPIRALVVDADGRRRATLHGELSRRSDVQLVATLGSGAAALQAVEDHRPDLVFLSLDLPDAEPDDLLDMIGAGESPPLLILASDDPGGAWRALQVEAVDYLVRPVASERLETALARARRRMLERRAGALLEQLMPLVEEGSGNGRRASAPDGNGAAASPGPYVGTAERTGASESTRAAQGAGAQGAGIQGTGTAERGSDGTPRREPAPRANRFVTRKAGRLRVVPVDQIERIEAAGSYVGLHSEEGSYLLRRRMKQMEADLDPALFLRIHRSHIVRLARIREICPRRSGRDYSVLLADGTRLPVSRDRRDALEARLRESP